MFRGQCLQGQRILGPGGDSRLGRPPAERFPAPGADAAIRGRREPVCGEAAAARRAQFARRCIGTFGVERHVAAAAPELVEAPRPGGACTGQVNHAIGNFVAPTESLPPSALDAVAGIVVHGSLGATQAVGQRRLDEAGAAPGGRAGSNAR